MKSFSGENDGIAKTIAIEKLKRNLFCVTFFNGRSKIWKINKILTGQLFCFSFAIARDSVEGSTLQMRIASRNLLHP
jgi:hypothetical protein